MLPAGTWLVRISGSVQSKDDAWNFRLASLGPLYCSDGTPLADLVGVIGTPKPQFNPQSVSSTARTGFERIAFHWERGSGLRSITLDSTVSLGPPFAEAQTWNGQPLSTAELACPLGQKVAGISGIYIANEPVVLTLGVRCTSGEMWQQAPTGAEPLSDTQTSTTLCNGPCKLPSLAREVGC